MPEKNRHTWTFIRHFRARGYGWNGSALASKRIKQAVTEIRKMAGKDPCLAAEGAIRLMGRFWPSLDQIDSSSGALGNAVYSAVQELIPIIIEAPADEKTREKWLKELWKATEADGVDFISPVLDRWGEICGSTDLATKWIDELIFPVRHTFQDKTCFSYFKGTTALLSCLLVCGRYDELFELLKISGRPWWHYGQYGVKALLAMGKKREALQYAEASRGLNDPGWLIDQTCEEILLSSGLYEEAYERYGLSANSKMSNLATFKAIAKKYPSIDKKRILYDLIASTPGAEGKWFATAKDLGFFDLALELIKNSPCDPKTLNRAARDFSETNPAFAVRVALSSLRWIAEGYGYEITGLDVHQAFSLALQAAKYLGTEEETLHNVRAIINSERLPGNFVSRVLSVNVR